MTHCEAPCLGYSQLNAKTVNELVTAAAPVSMSLALVALVMWLIGGILFGILAAVTQGSFLDRGIVGLTLIAYAFPSFFIGVFFLKFVAVKWGILSYPSYSPIEEFGLTTWFSNLLLPGFTLALLFMAGVCPDDPSLRARVAQRGLHPHREGEGPQGSNGAVQARAAGGADATRDDGRPRLRDAAGRSDHHRERVRLSRASGCLPCRPAEPSTYRRRSASSSWQGRS